jgi:pentatricopeptide repeat protein
MRNIILATINNNQKCIHDMCSYFSAGNEEEAKKFLTYMRNRDITEEKNKWMPQ